MSAARHIIILCFLLQLVLFNHLIAQEIPHFLEKLTTTEGLSSNKINDMVQDDNGFLWIATGDGLNRFDGTEVMQYFHQQAGNSIPHNYVYCLKKLSNNRIAIGTLGGLSFYDGNTGMFHNFYYKTGKLDEYNNTIIKLEIDSRGNLWAASRSCLFIFDPQQQLKKVISSDYTEADAARLRLQFAEKIIPLADGPVLLALQNGWNVYSPETNEMALLPASPLKNRLNFLQEVTAKYLSGNVGIYFPASHIFKVFDNYFLCIKPNADSLVLYNSMGNQIGNCYFPYNKFPFTLWSQKVVMIDSSRLLFIFHNYGVAVIPITWEQQHPVIHPLASLLFPEHEYETSLVDKQGNLWLATSEEGLLKMSPHKQLFAGHSLIDQQTGQMTKYEVISILKHGNTLWVCTYGEGFYEIDLTSGKQHQHNFEHTGDDTWSNFTWNIRYVSKDTLWVGTQAGMYWYNVQNRKYGHLPAYPGKPTCMDSVAITTQFTDSKGLTWMGIGRGKGVCVFDNKTKQFAYYPGNSSTGYPLRYPLGVVEDINSDLWFVSDASNLLTKWNRQSNKFEAIALPGIPNTSLSNLCTVFMGDNKTLWIGTVASGLIKFDIDKHATSFYGHDKGLNNTHLNAIYEDNTHRLWLATEGGLSSFDPNSESFTNYSPNDGLPVKVPTSSFYFDAANMRLYNGGHGNYFYFNPTNSLPIPSSSKTIITAMQVNNQPFMLYGNEPAKFSPGQNDITILYTTVDLTDGPKTKYEYKLVGGDTGWIMAGNQRQINLSHLAPGHYIFMVRAAKSNGDWNTAPAQVAFDIRYPFTQTLWFYLLVLLAIVAIFYALYRFRLSQIMRAEEIRSEISRNLHDEVGSTLTNISLGSLLAQKQLQKEGPVNKILERIYQDSQTVSEAMREIVWSINPSIDTLGDALPRMLRYASELLEAKDIELQANLAPGIEQVKLSMQQRRDLYLFFKEALNNLAKHSQATFAKIDFHLDGKSLVILIADNGTGFDTRLPLLNNGLKNMKERAKSNGWQLNILSKPGAGTNITLHAIIA